MNNIPHPLSLEYIKYRLAFYIFYPPDYTSINGRALFEGRSYVHQLSSEDYVICPYSGERHRHTKPMNRAALKSTAKNLTEIKDIINSYGQMLRLQNQIGNETLVELWRLTYVGWTSPLFQVLKQRAPFVIDNSTADLSKFCHGILTLLRSLFENKTPPLSKWTAQQLHDYAENEHLLIGYKEVCAAPATLITSILEHIIEQTNSSRWANGNQGRLAENSNEILIFSQARWLMERACIVYESTRYITHLAFGTSSPIKQRHSFPYTMTIANYLTSEDSTLSKLYNYWLTNKTYLSNSDLEDIEFNVEKITDISYEIESNLDSYDKSKKFWYLLEDSMLVILQRVETVFCTMTQVNDVYQYKKIDLSIFFGASVFEKQTHA